MCTGCPDIRGKEIRLRLKLLLVIIKIVMSLFL